MGGKETDLEEGRSWIEKATDPLPGQKFAALQMTPPRLRRSSLHDGRSLAFRLVDQTQHALPVAAIIRAGGINGRFQNTHGAVRAKSSRPISMRRISDVPAPIS